MLTTRRSAGGGVLPASPGSALEEHHLRHNPGAQSALAGEPTYWRASIRSSGYAAWRDLGYLTEQVYGHAARTARG